MLIPFRELFDRYRIRTDGVLHLGANTGQEAPEYVRLGIKQVIWVEALASVSLLLRRNIQKYSHHRALCACLSDRDGDEVEFHVASNDAQSSSFLEFGTHSKEHPTVKWVDHLTLATTRVDTLLKQNAIELKGRWFLNVDLQGAELLALKGMGELLWRFDYAYIEVNEKELYKGCPLVGEIDSYLKDFGLLPKEKKMTGAGWGDKFYARGTVL